MQDLASRIHNFSVSEGSLGIIYLGQAGFILKDSNGKLVAIDLYLSDCVERYDGFKRLMPKLLCPNDLVYDIIITTHAHYDHFDIDAVPLMMENEQTILLAAYDCKVECEKYHVNPGRTIYLREGDNYTLDDINITAVFCDHGVNTPDAIGLLIEIGGKRVYVAGDTSLHLDEGMKIAKENVDVMIVPINGAFGNLNEMDAVSLCEVVQPKLVIPCHYWCFAEHGGNPLLFINELNSKLPSQNYLIMRMGDICCLNG